MPTAVTKQKQNNLRKGLLEYCTLLAIGQGRAYSSDILQTLQTADMLLVEGTLYPLLNRLKTQGLLSYDWEESKSGPPRKYFTLTNDGEEVLRELTTTWRDLQTSLNALIAK